MKLTNSKYDSGTKEAPPTKPPSMFGLAINSLTLAGFTEPPYWIRTLSATSWSYKSATVFLTTAQISSAWSDVAVLPVPIARLVRKQ